MVQLPHKVKGNVKKSRPQCGLEQLKAMTKNTAQTGFSISMKRCAIAKRSARWLPSACTPKRSVA